MCRMVVQAVFLVAAILGSINTADAQMYGKPIRKTVYWQGRPLGDRYASGITIWIEDKAISSGWYSGGGRVWGYSQRGPSSTSHFWKDSLGNELRAVTKRNNDVVLIPCQGDAATESNDEITQ